MQIKMNRLTTYSILKFIGPDFRTSKFILTIIFGFFTLQPCFSSVATKKNWQYFDRIMSENIKVERGISQNSVKTIMQDDKGFMWFGTLDGLNRYDGYSFVSYNKEQGLSNESIKVLFQSGDTIWIGTEMGLNYLTLQTDSIHVFQESNPLKYSLATAEINNIYKDHAGTIWVCTSKSLVIVNASQNQGSPFKLLEDVFHLNDIQYNMIIQDHENNYYIATNCGLFVIYSKTLSVKRFVNEELNKLSLPHNQVNTIAFSSNQQLVVGTKSGLIQFDKNLHTFHQIPTINSLNHPLSTNEILSIVNESEKGIWVGTYDSGLYFIESETNEVSNYVYNSSINYSLSNNRVFSLCFGSQDILWIGTFNGISKLDKNVQKFKCYRTNNEDQSGFSNNQVWCFLEYSQHKLLVGTDNGISLFDKTNSIYTDFKELNQRLFGDKNIQIRCIYKDHKGNYWFGSRNNGLFRYDPIKRKRVQYQYEPTNNKSISSNLILNIIEDKNGIIWIATNNGLNRFENDHRGFKAYFHNETDTTSLAHNRIYDLAIDSTNHLWISTANGLSCFNEETESFSNYLIPKSQLKETAGGSNFFYTIHLDHDSIIWIGTRGGGLAAYDIHKDKFTVLTSHDGLSDNVIYCILEDPYHNLWISTNWGLSRYNRTEFTNFYVTDGLQSNEFNWNAGYIASDGEFYLGGMNGFNTFYPEEPKQQQEVQKLRVIEYKKFNILQKISINNGDTIWLRYDDNFFSFSFAALDFSNPSKINYRYMLENYDTKWIEKNAEHRLAEYTHVPHGTYKFRLMATNIEDRWNGKELSFTIIIKPPWYATWYINTIGILVICIMIYLIIVQRIKILNKKHEDEKQIFAVEKQLYQLEQKALQLQMNPHFLFNALNSIQGLILGNDINGAIHYLSKFSKLMRQTLSNSGESLIPLQDELYALRLYLEIESFRFGDRFTFNIKVDPSIDEEFIEIPPMILQPYVENAIIHGLLHKKSKGYLLIELTKQGQHLHCLIQDNGIGRKRAMEIRAESGIERKSKGMVITSERLAILNRLSDDTYAVHVTDLFDENGNASGTKVEVNIHLKK